MKFGTVPDRGRGREEEVQRYHITEKRGKIKFGLAILHRAVYIPQEAQKNGQNGDMAKMATTKMALRLAKFSI